MIGHEAAGAPHDESLPLSSATNKDGVAREGGVVEQGIGLIMNGRHGHLLLPP